MKIPAAYQIFDAPVTLTEKDCERLRPHLAAWMKLHETLLLGVNVPDLQRLILLELLGAKRRDILKRLIARYGQERNHLLWAKADKILTI